MYQRFHIRKKEKVPFDRPRIFHSELGLEADDVVVLAPEVGAGSGEHRGTEVDHQAGHRREEGHPHEVGKRIHVRGGEDISRLSDGRLLQLPEHPRTPPGAPQQDLGQAHRRLPGEDQERAAGEVTQHVHQHRGDHPVGECQQLGDLFQRRDPQAGHVDQNPAAGHLRKGGCGMPGAHVGDLSQGVELRVFQLPDVDHQRVAKGWGEAGALRRGRPDFRRPGSARGVRPTGWSPPKRRGAFRQPRQRP